MLPTNVMSFMKKIVANEESVQQHSQEGTFGKLKQTLSSSLLTGPEKGAKVTLQVTDSDNPNAYGDSGMEGDHHGSQQQPYGSSGPSTETSRRSGACRVCLKSFKPDDFSKTCLECNQRVCEDCASYSKSDENEDLPMWRCSVCRRKISSRFCLPQDSTDSMLEIPVMEALQRRHSDVKLGASCTTGLDSDAGLAPPRSPEVRRHSDVSPASLKELEKLKSAKQPGEVEWIQSSRSNAPSPRRGDFDGIPVSRMGSRRSSRISRQHSYDDDMKGCVINPATNTSEMGLGLPTIPRRKSAYDVFAPSILQAAVAAAGGNPLGVDMLQAMGPPGSRRPSVRPQISTDDIINKEDTPSPDMCISTLKIEDDGKFRRRSSQLPEPPSLDCGVIPTNQLPINFTAPALEDLEAPKRQTSMDGEAIKIVIHDFDSGPVRASKRQTHLRRNPTDKAHRTRGYGMRVVGGKTGTDGRLFAYIVWTVPGGPAEKGGLQPGDKILEWNDMSLIDRSFEEVCSIMDKTGDTIDLLIEHGTDFRMCDVLDDGFIALNLGGQRKSGDGPVGLGFVTESENSTEKSPSSPTRRKLPKTPV